MPGKSLFTWLHCSCCGRKMGKKQGVQVILNVVCDDPICQFQEPPTVNLQRDGLIVAAVLEGVPVSRIAVATKMSRQRVYQILDAWKEGV